MMERTDYWRGFTGGLITGVAIGAWIYFSPRMNRQTIDFDSFDRETADGLAQGRKPGEGVNNPSLHVPPIVESNAGER
jgi:hypothetical protein